MAVNKYFCYPITSNMLVTITPHAVALHVTAPPSKSYLQRAIALALFSDQECHIHGYESSNDVDAALEVVRILGKKVVLSGTTLQISGTIIKATEFQVTMGESGLATRMFAPLFAVLGFPKTTINGEGSLLERPVTAIVDLLTQLKCSASFYSWSFAHNTNWRDRFTISFLNNRRF